MTHGKQTPNTCYLNDPVQNQEIVDSKKELRKKEK